MRKCVSLLLAALFLFGCAFGAWAEIAPEETPDAATDLADESDWLYDEDAALTEDGEEWDDEAYDDESYDEEFYDGEVLAGDDFLSEVDETEDTLMSAMEVYSWFVMQPLDGDPDRPNADGTAYAVLDDRFDTMDELKTFVSGYFSDAIVQELFAMDVYTEIDGLLYVADTGRMMDESIGEMEFAVTEQTAEKTVYTVTVFYWDDTDEGRTEDFAYVRELIDGAWKFTEFPFFW